MSLSVEPSKLHLIYDTSLLNARCRFIGLSLDSVRPVTVLGWGGCYQESLDKSGFHKVILHPVARPVFGGQFGMVSRTSGWFAIWLEQEPVIVPIRPPVREVSFTGARYSGSYVYC